MTSFTVYILTAVSLIFVIEGLIYGLFPDSVRKMMAIAIQMPKNKLRFFGLTMAFTGFMMIWILKLL